MKTFPVYKFGVDRPNSVARASLAPPPAPENYNKNYLKGKPKPTWSAKAASPYMSSTPAGVPAAKIVVPRTAPAQLYNADYLKSDGSRPQPQKVKAWSEKYAKNMLDEAQPPSDTPAAPPSSKLTVQTVIDALKLVSETNLTDAEDVKLRKHAVELSVLLAAEKKSPLDDAQMRSLEEINADIGGMMSLRIEQQKSGLPFAPKNKTDEKMEKLKKILSEVILTTTTTEADKKEQAQLIENLLKKASAASSEPPAPTTFLGKLKDLWDKKALPAMTWLAKAYLTAIINKTVDVNYNDLVNIRQRRPPPANPGNNPPGNVDVPGAFDDDDQWNNVELEDNDQVGFFEHPGGAQQIFPGIYPEFPPAGENHYFNQADNDDLNPNNYLDEPLSPEDGDNNDDLYNLEPIANRQDEASWSADGWPTPAVNWDRPQLFSPVLNRLPPPRAGVFTPLNLNNQFEEPNTPRRVEAPVVGEEKYADDGDAAPVDYRESILFQNLKSFALRPVGVKITANERKALQDEYKEQFDLNHPRDRQVQQFFNMFQRMYEGNNWKSALVRLQSIIGRPMADEMRERMYARENEGKIIQTRAAKRRGAR